MANVRLWNRGVVDAQRRGRGTRGYLGGSRAPQAKGCWRRMAPWPSCILYSASSIALSLSTSNASSSQTSFSLSAGAARRHPNIKSLRRQRGPAAGRPLSVFGQARECPARATESQPRAAVNTVSARNSQSTSYTTEMLTLAFKHAGPRLLLVWTSHAYVFGCGQELAILRVADDENECCEDAD